MDKTDLYWQRRLYDLERRIEKLEAINAAKDIDPNNDSDFYTIKEMEKILKINRQTIIRKIKSDKLKGYKVGRTWRIPKSEINEIFD